MPAPLDATALLDLRASVEAAEARIRGHVVETPLIESPVLSELVDANVHLKLENLQVTGSFKARGAFNRMLSLTPEERAAGVVTASSGNHGAAVALAAGKLGLNALVFVPNNAAQIKVDNIRRQGARVEFFGDEGGATEVYARRYADEHAMVYVSPYNDLTVIAGQGTIGFEIAKQLPAVDVVVASIGGGGLIAGIAGYLKALHPQIHALGISALNTMAMAASIRAGRIIDTIHLPTLSDGTAGSLEPGAITFELCSALVDALVEVPEDEIRSALRLFIDAHHMLCEGAAALAIAGLLAAKADVRGKNVAVVICGANISSDQLRNALAR